jgi:hypothetical protein
VTGTAASGGGVDEIKAKPAADELQAAGVSVGLSHLRLYSPKLNYNHQN